MTSQNGIGNIYGLYKECRLCARNCGVDRLSGNRGYCGVDSKLYISRAALHKWEEPCISGVNGSGAIFFSGCSLKCIYCQNREISRGESGVEVSNSRLSEIMLNLQKQGAHNINLVTPTHYAPSIVDAVEQARASGLVIPIVYNTSSFENLETLELIKDTVDVFLPDLKYYRSKTAKEYSYAENLPLVSKCAIEKMVKLSGKCRFDKNGIITRGVIVRILLLPSHLAEAKLNLKHLWDSFGNDIYISLMSQYTPIGNLPKPLDRRVTRAEYRELVEYAESLGITNAYTQDFESAEESFIPPFDLTGVSDYI